VSGSAPTPAAPTNLIAQAGPAQVKLWWNPSLSATSYNIYRGTTAGGESTTAIATGVTGTTYTDTGRTNGTKYYYKVKAVNFWGAGSYSNEASATPSATATASNIWPNNPTPASTDAGDTTPIEAGVKIRSTVAGKISGIRFYKADTNTGTHVGHLWSSAGTLLGTVTFTGETASGWQTATFATPITISANTTYIASYSDPNGHYSADGAYFLSAGGTNLNLTALQTGVDGNNGVYSTTLGAFPTGSYNATNYWVDVVFTP